VLPACFTCTIFNVILLPGVPFTVDPSSLAFLRVHGFDFNALLAHGIPYTPRHLPADAQQPATPENPVSAAFWRIMDAWLAPSEPDASPPPLVVHNGFCDALFLWAHFQTSLPGSLTEFVARLSTCFPRGIYDTKVLSDYVWHDAASYLEYVYHKRRRINQQWATGASVQTAQGEHVSTVRILLCPSPGLDDYVELLPVRSARNSARAAPLCRSFAAHGHCPRSGHCPDAHDVERAVDLEMGTDRAAELSASPTVQDGVHQRESHRAGFDAFMTGFIFATALADGTALQCQNRVNLVGKTRPLVVARSAFVR
jgi:target of EGR1 protein 1